MTLSNAQVLEALRGRFACGWTNIGGRLPYAGTSNSHRPCDGAARVNNGSGHHNVQMFFLTADGRVVHCLPGFWEPGALLHEIALAVRLDEAYRSGKPAHERNDRFLDLHLAHALGHSAELREASQLQPFDQWVMREHPDFARPGKRQPTLKQVDQVVHERMAERPFVPFEKFDVPSFVDLGQKEYRYNDGLPRGR